MRADDWYRNEIWTDEIEQRFNEQLKRSRGSYNKSQYLRIQAGIFLRSSKKEIQEIGTMLAKRIFSDFAENDKDVAASRIMITQELGDYYMSKGDYSLAASQYLMIANKSLRQSACNGNSDVPLRYIDAVLKGKLTEQYQSALSILKDFSVTNLLFPSDFFLAAKVGAFLHYELRNLNEARKFALEALRYAEDIEPRFKRYPHLGVPCATKEELDLLFEIVE